MDLTAHVETAARAMYEHQGVGPEWEFLHPGVRYSWHNEVAPTIVALHEAGMLTGPTDPKETK